MTLYAKAADKPPSESADVDSVNMVPESPVFTSISTLQRRQQEVLVVDSTQPAVDVTDDHSRKDDRASAEDNANAEKVFYSYCNFLLCLHHCDRHCFCMSSVSAVYVMLFLCDFYATVSLCFCKNLLELCNEYLYHLSFAHQLSKFSKRLYMVYFLQYLVAPRTCVSNWLC